jgi:hypothetical protein
MLIHVHLRIRQNVQGGSSFLPRIPTLIRRRRNLFRRLGLRQESLRSSVIWVAPTHRRVSFIVQTLWLYSPLTLVVGEMKWNAKTLRWEGNEQILREFDVAVGTSTRPALITHLTGSSATSPVGSFGGDPRKVGDMMFDPIRMCWISTLPPEEDEPDVFANLADDEDGRERKGGTIRASLTPSSVTPDRSVSPSSTSSMLLHFSSPRTHSRTMSESSGSDRGCRPLLLCDVDDIFREKCRLAEQRHRMEMRGWQLKSVGGSGAPDRSGLYDIRALATRRY